MQLARSTDGSSRVITANQAITASVAPNRHHVRNLRKPTPTTAKTNATF